MTIALTLFAAVALPALAQQPPALPDAPQPATQTAEVKERLRQAVFAPRAPAKPQTYQEALQRRMRESFENPGHRVLTEAELEQDAPPQVRADRETAFAHANQSIISKRETVELSFLHPLPGLDAGIGMSDRRDWVGPFKSRPDHSAFAFVRIPLGRAAQDRPVLTLPEARVTNTRGPGNLKTSVDNYSIRDLPPGLIP